jgi:hypothetical protein
MRKNSALCGIAQSRNSEMNFVFKKVFLWLCAMQLNVKFKSKIFLLTPRYAAQQGVDSALCRIAGSRNSVLCGIARSHNSALCGIAWSCDSALCCIGQSFLHSGESE